MRRYLLIILAVVSIPPGVMLIRYAVERREQRDDPAPSTTAPPMARGLDMLDGELVQVEQRENQHTGPQRGVQGGRKPGIGESYSAVRQPTGDGTSAVQHPTSPADVTSVHAGKAPTIGVAGSPFSASASVMEACEPAKPGVFRWSACDRVNELLIQIAEEPRDEAWAAATEKALRAYAEQEPGKFTIRALECRRTICFLETASIFEDLPMPDYYFHKSNGLHKEYPVDVYETDAAGTRWHITLLPFTRE